MGLAYGRFPEAHFGAVGKWRLNWLPESSIEFITRSQTNHLYAFDRPELIPGGKHALVIAKNYDTDYWVSVRSQIADNTWMNNGVLLHWSSAEIGGDSVLLDTTRGTRQLRTDSALVVGRTFTDPEALVHVTPVARGLEGSLPWVDVVVHLGTSTSNLPPQVELQVPSLRALPGQPVRFTAEVFDPNFNTTLPNIQRFYFRQRINMETTEVLNNAHDNSMNLISFVDCQLDSYSLEDRSKLLTLASRKLRHNGKLIITGHDVIEMSRALYKGYLSMIEYNNLLRRSLISLEYAEDMLEALGLQIIIKRVNNYKYYIESKRP